MFGALALLPTAALAFAATNVEGLFVLLSLFSRFC